ncbi:hypothetical protein HDK64DRAFT_105913 [Phyllosticta capitalensis]
MSPENAKNSARLRALMVLLKFIRGAYRVIPLPGLSAASDSPEDMKWLMYHGLLATNASNSGPVFIRGNRQALRDEFISSSYSNLRVFGWDNTPKIINIFRTEAKSRQPSGIVESTTNEIPSRNIPQSWGETCFRRRSSPSPASLARGNRSKRSGARASLLQWSHSSSPVPLPPWHVNGFSGACLIDILVFTSFAHLTQ